MIQVEMFPVPAMPSIASDAPISDEAAINDLPSVIERLASVSNRPRYAFMVLNLIGRAAGQGGKAGPYVVEHGSAVRLRDWLCDALSPMASRDPKRVALIAEVRRELENQGLLPTDQNAADCLIDETVRERVRSSGLCNVSRAVSELVRVGLVRRHYQGWRVDHHNRGARRQAVYTLTPAALRALGKT